MLAIFVTIMIVVFTFYLKIDPLVVFRKYTRACNKEVKNNTVQCNDGFIKALKDYEKNTKLKANPDRHLGELCDFFITIIVYKIYSENFNYEAFIKTVNKTYITKTSK